MDLKTMCHHAAVIVDPGASNPKGVCKELWDMLCTMPTPGKICLSDSTEGACIRLVMAQLTYLLQYDDAKETTKFGDDLKLVRAYAFHQEAQGGKQHGQDQDTAC